MRPLRSPRVMPHARTWLLCVLLLPLTAGPAVAVSGTGPNWERQFTESADGTRIAFYTRGNARAGQRPV